MSFWVHGRDSRSGQPIDAFFSKTDHEEEARAEAVARGFVVDGIERAVQDSLSDAEDEHWHLEPIAEELTGRCQRVMQLAQAEAERLNHDEIGSEHILLGLIAAGVLKNLDLGTIRAKVEMRKPPQPRPDVKQVRPPPPRPAPAITDGLPRLDIERVGRPQPRSAPAITDGLPQTPRARKVVECAIAEARKLHCDIIDTEHLLLGLLSEQEGVAAQVFINLGRNLDNLCAQIRLECSARGAGNGAATVEPSTEARISNTSGRLAESVEGTVLFTERCRKAWRRATAEARRLNHDYVGTEHILLGLILEDSGDAVLKKLGLDGGAIQRELKTFSQLHPIDRAPDTFIRLGPNEELRYYRPLSYWASAILSLAKEEASPCEEPRVDTEHLLLGLLRVDAGVAAEILRNLDLDLGNLFSSMQQEFLERLNDPAMLKRWHGGSAAKTSKVTCLDRSPQTRAPELNLDLPHSAPTQPDGPIGTPVGLTGRQMPDKQRSYVNALGRISRRLTVCLLHAWAWGWMAELAAYLLVLHWVGEATPWGSRVRAIHFALVFLFLVGILVLVGITSTLYYGVRCTQCRSFLSRQQVVSHSAQIYKCGRCRILWDSGIRDDRPTG
jgi:ATP-dependent Clp protease ATP-binding subunit ClpA